VALATDVGTRLAAEGYGLVSGGGRVSMMGAVARAARAGGAHTVGVIPAHLVPLEVADTDADELIVVDTMRDRKALMDARADAFIALPGGIGTLEELFEVWTWSQLGLQHKPCALLNVAGYYDHLLAFLDHMTGERFLSPIHRGMAIVDDDPERLLDRLAAWNPPSVRKWIDADEL
jgi:uncharacterized protein (TIGR00730 family)